MITDGMKTNWEKQNKSRLKINQTGNMVKAKIRNHMEMKRHRGTEIKITCGLDHKHVCACA